MLWVWFGVGVYAILQGCRIKAASSSNLQAKRLTAYTLTWSEGQQSIAISATFFQYVYQRTCAALDHCRCAVP